MIRVITRYCSLQSTVRPLSVSLYQQLGGFSSGSDIRKKLLCLYLKPVFPLRQAHHSEARWTLLLCMSIIIHHFDTGWVFGLATLKWTVNLLEIWAFSYLYTVHKLCIKEVHLRFREKNIWTLVFDTMPKYSFIYLFIVTLCHIKLCYVMLCYFILFYFILFCYVMLCYVTPCYVMFHHIVILCYVMLYYVILCCVMLLYIMWCYCSSCDVMFHDIMLC